MTASENNLIDDHCDFSANQVICGDKCVDLYYDNCACGDTNLTHGDIFRDGKHCCIDPHCTMTKSDYENDLDRNDQVFNAIGSDSYVNNTTKCFEVKARNEACNGRCINDYKYSDPRNLGYATASFYCPEPQELCTKVVDLCRGVSWCQDDVRICNKQLRCPTGYFESGFTYFDYVSTATMKNHTYCNYTEKFHDGSFDFIDRSDESFEIQFGSRVSEKIAYETMKKCNDSFGNWIGLMCGHQCLEFRQWCLNTDIYTRQNCGTFYSDNSILCKNSTFWRSVPCDIYHYLKNSFGYNLSYKGIRCSGKIQHCSFPWYSDFFGYGMVPKTCNDKSDEIFNIGTRCIDNDYNYISIWRHNFCNDLSFQTPEICRIRISSIHDQLQVKMFVPIDVSMDSTTNMSTYYKMINLKIFG